MYDDLDQPTLLFVYGTLMPGHGNHHRIEQYVRRGCPGKITGILIDLGAFPALIPGDGIVEGILLDVDQASLEITDHIEGYAPDRNDCLYIRKKTIVKLSDDKEVWAWRDVRPWSYRSPAYGLRKSYKDRSDTASCWKGVYVRDAYP